VVVVVVGLAVVVVVAGGGTCVVVVTAVVVIGAAVVVTTVVDVVVTLAGVVVETGVETVELGVFDAVLSRVCVTEPVTTTTVGVPLGDRTGSAEGLPVNNAAKTAPVNAPTAILPGTPDHTGPAYLDHPIGSNPVFQ
jgi:hypothetical protein